MSFKYSETYIEDIKKICNDILKVADAIKEGKEKRRPMLAKDFKPEKIVFDTFEYDLTREEALGFLDSSIYMHERTLSLILLNLHVIEEERRIKNTLMVEIGPLGYVDPTRCASIKFQN